MVRAPAFLILSLFGSALAVAAPQFDQGAESRKSDCDASSPVAFTSPRTNRGLRMAASMPAFPAVHAPMIRPKCDADVMPESIERQHTGCQARNLDFTFDAEKVCGITSEVTSTSAASLTTRDTVTTSHVSHGSSATSVSASTTSGLETTSSTQDAESASSTAQESSTGGAAPVTDSAPRLSASLGVLSMLFMVIGIAL
ncbi:hypothetical protein FMUND_1596 [Fusarium mundagurra]|uniref:Uncharacterized protein n=1 Tax=Fusarium mundagurra TaxID=1567541 RepID=A0A8H5Z666_9HYPO|nr:hypothetical protein FMUND_1596 [Fusarium mundagurra]